MTISQLLSQYEPQSSTFATHINLLRALGPGIRTVLELGAESSRLNCSWTVATILTLRS